MDDKVKQAQSLAMLADLQSVLGANRKRAFGDKSEADDVGHIVLGDAYFGDEAIKAKKAKATTAAHAMPTTEPVVPPIIAPVADLIRAKPPAGLCWHTVILYVAVAALAAAFLFLVGRPYFTSAPTADHHESVILMTE